MTSPRRLATTDAPGIGQLGQLGRYRLRQSLGVGGQAEVFKADYSAPGGFERTVVIKKILPANCADPEFVRMFAAEARILGMLHHPNVVQAYDVGAKPGAACATCSGAPVSTRPNSRPACLPRSPSVSTG